MRHQDFDRVKREFENYYCKGVSPCPKGEYEYYQWLNALKLDETLCYGQTHEKFMWAKDMLKAVGEDADNKYYKVLVAFPLKSMNGNIYHEADLKEDAKTITRGHPSINHKEDFWLGPGNKYGPSVDITGAEFEDGAVEALMKVPKTTLCPVCTERNKPLYQMIDEKRIVNVSLEGFNSTDGRFAFSQHTPFTLLTCDVLPGIPMARVFPIEAYLPFKSSNYTGQRKIKIVGIKKEMTETPKCNCPPGMHDEEGKCVADDDASKEAVDSVTGIDPTQPNADLKKPHPMTVSITSHNTVQQGSPCSTMPDTSGEKMVLGEAQLRVDVLKLKQKAEALELAKAETEVTLQKSYEAQSRLIGEKTQMQATIDRLEQQLSVNNKEQITAGTEVKSLSRRLEDMVESRDGYKKDFELLKAEHEATVSKYREALKTNLAIERKLTETNEEYLAQAKRSEALEDKVKHVNRITRITAKV
jgi:hypothetical protein